VTGTKLWGQLAPRADGQPGWLDGEPAAATGQPKRTDYHDRVAWKQANAPSRGSDRGRPPPPRQAKVDAALRAAHAAAVRLKAAPLRRELELLAQRGRVRLQAATKPSPATAEAPSMSASLGLTAREAEVLALVAAGRTNRQIGRACSSPQDRQRSRLKDPGKLGVAGRGEAAAIDHRLGLDKP
jgi:hypothetical protein